MRSGVAAVQNTLTPPAQNVLRHAIHNAQSRGHTHVQPLHVALVLLSHGGPLLRQACADLHPQTPHGLQQCHALELCFNVALDRLPQSSSNNTHPLALSNALAAALKRAQAHQKRGCPEQQQPCLVAVKVEIEQLIISILEDPSVSRVMKEAGFVSQQVKTNLENAISLSSSLQQGKDKSFSSDLEPPLVGCVEARPPRLPSPWVVLENSEDSNFRCCRECMSHFEAECEQLRGQDSAQVEVAVSPLPSWLQKEKDIKSEQEKCDSLSRKIQDLQQKWHLFCRTSHSSRDMAALGLLPFHSRTDSNISNNTGSMAANPFPMESVDFSSLPVPTPSQAPVDFSSLPIPTTSQALNREHWTRSLPPIAPSEGPRPMYSNAIGSKSQGLENTGKQATLASNNKTGSLQLGGLKSIEQGRSQPSPSPLSRLQAKSSTSDCPLRTNPLSSPLSIMKASKPLLKVNSPLAQKQLPSKPVATLLKNDNKAPVFFDQKAAERLKHVYKGVLEKVSWQSNAISQIATALVNTQSGMGKGARADTWLLLLGPDQVGKGLVADTLAELVMGKGKKPVCFGLIQDLGFWRWGRKEERQLPRVPPTLDSLAEALRTNPLCVLLLENIDQADSVVRTNLAKAMETGKFMDSSLRQVNVGNAIILMTSKVGTEDSKDNLFREDRVSPLFHGARMKLTLELPVESKQEVFRDHNIRVVKDATLAPVVAAKVVASLKRKPAGFPKPAVCEKRSKLDLNLSAEENECQDESGSSRQESKACNADPVLSAAQQALTPRFFNLVDNAVVFEPFDTMEQASWILSQLSRACSSLDCRNIEVDFQLMEHMVGVLWRTPGGNQAFETWVQEKLKACLNAFTAGDDPIGDRLLRFVYEDSFSKELCSASELPLQIELGSR